MPWPNEITEKNRTALNVLLSVLYCAEIENLENQWQKVLSIFFSTFQNSYQLHKGIQCATSNNFTDAGMEKQVRERERERQRERWMIIICLHCDDECWCSIGDCWLRRQQPVVCLYSTCCAVLFTREKNACSLSMKDKHPLLTRHRLFSSAVNRQFPFDAASPS